MALPKVLKNFNMIVAGQGYAGKCDEVTLPKLAIKKVDHQGGGMDAPVALDMGMELLTCGFTMAEHNAEIFKQFGLISGNEVQCTFRAAMVDDTTVEPYVVTVRGMYTELEAGSLKVGDKNGLKASLALRYYRLEINNTQLIEIDVINFVRKINGVDQLQQLKSALQL